MTSPTLPACIPTAQQLRRVRTRRQRQQLRSIRRKQFHDAVILFVFFTFFFAIITVAAFS